MTLKSTIEAARAYLDPQQVNCVLYHYPCSDGSGAALCAWIALGDKAIYEPLAYTKPFDEEKLRAKNVVILDASFKKAQLQHIRKLANKVLILDHHDSAMKDLTDDPGCCFHMGNSGAALSWHYFHGVDTPAPRLISLIEDRDLWVWRDREASEALFYALMDLYPDSDFREYEKYLDEKNLAKAIKHGQTLKTANELWCATMAAKSQRKTFMLPGSLNSYTVMCLELESDKLISELSEFIYTRHDVDFTLFWIPLGADKYKLSFRNNRQDINLADIATALGGGGHPRAAGAVIKGTPFTNRATAS